MNEDKGFYEYEVRMTAGDCLGEQITFAIIDGHFED